MNILYINTFNPYEEVHGGATVTRKELEILSSISTVTTIFGEPLRRRKYYINPFRFLKDILSGRSFKLASYSILHRKPEFYEKFDLIFCNHDFAAYDYEVFKSLNKPFIVRKHNIEHKFFSENNPLQRAERNRIKRFEEDLGFFSSAIIHLSSSEYLEDNSSHRKYHLFPPLISDQMLADNSFVLPYIQVNRTIDILCITNYEWKPNKEGFDWFFEEIAPLLGGKFNIHLVGKGSDRYAGYPSVTSHGYVKDVSEFYNKAKVFIAPVLSGAGIKIKNLEAIIYGVPVVTTPLGVDGLNSVSENGGVTVANTAEEFAQELSSLIADEERCRSQREVALSWAQSNVVGAASWRSQIKDIIDRIGVP